MNVQNVNLGSVGCRAALVGFCAWFREIDYFEFFWFVRCSLCQHLFSGKFDTGKLDDLL